jgi:hypothetical protein
MATMSAGATALPRMGMGAAALPEVGPFTFGADVPFDFPVGFNAATTSIGSMGAA